jgi:seryl-tRNA synthetase
MSLKTLLSYLSEVRANLSEAEKGLNRAAKLLERIINSIPDVIADYVDDVERLEIEKALIGVWEKVKIASSLVSDACFLALRKDYDLGEILLKLRDMEKAQKSTS